MRIVVTGVHGQISRALQALPALDIIAIGRPGFDLMAVNKTPSPLREMRPDVIINAAAYTAVDKAEQERAAAFAANEAGARAVAEIASDLGTPLIQISTDYVFDGCKGAPYVESDATNPLSVYGASKLAGERAVTAVQPRSVILRLSGVYSPHGANFVRTMLRLAGEREEVSVVDDQRTAPMAAADVANALALIARNLVERTDDTALHGLYHLGGAGEASWSEFAEAIFETSRAQGGPSARVRRITSAEFGAAAQRPADSRLDGAKLLAAHGASLPPWRQSLSACVAEILRG